MSNDWYTCSNLPICQCEKLKGELAVLKAENERLEMASALNMESITHITHMGSEIDSLRQQLALTEHQAKEADRLREQNEIWAKWNSGAAEQITDLQKRLAEAIAAKEQAEKTIKECGRMFDEVGIEHSGMSLQHQVKWAVFHIKQDHELNIRLVKEQAQTEKERA